MGERGGKERKQKEEGEERGNKMVKNRGKLRKRQKIKEIMRQKSERYGDKDKKREGRKEK